MSSYIVPRTRVAGGLRIRFAEWDSTDDPTVLLLSPWPESLYAWEALWPRLSVRARLIAVDLPGFGQSEASRELFSPRAMGEFIVRLIDEWGLGRPHVFAPGVGTAAVLFAASFAPSSLTSVVVGSGAIAYPHDVTRELKDLIDAPD